MTSPGAPGPDAWENDYVQLLTAHTNGQTDDLPAQAIRLATRLLRKGVRPDDVAQAHFQWLSAASGNGDAATRIARGAVVMQSVLGALDQQRLTHAASLHANTPETRRQFEAMQLAFEVTTDILWDWNLVTDEMTCDPPWFEILGYGPDELPRSHAEWCARLLHPDDIAPAQAIVQRHIDERSHGFRVEFRVRARDGQYRWLLGRGRVVEWGPDGEPLRMVGTNADITLRKNMEELLRIQRDLGVALAAATNLEEAAALVLDAGCRVPEVDCGGVYIVEQETGALRLMAHRGLSETFIATTKYHPPDSPHARIVQRGEPYYHCHAEMDFTHPRQRPENLRALAGLPFLYEGEAIGVVNFGSHVVNAFEQEVRDSLETLAANVGNIFARLRTEQSLRDSEVRYRVLAEYASDMISRADLNARWQYVSPACKRLLGYQPEELVGRDAYELFHPDEIAAIRAKHEHMLRTRETVTIEQRFRRRDGEWVWCECSGRAVHDSASGEVREIVIITRDISERKRAEAALRESEARYRVLAEYASDMISRTSPDGVWQYVSPACERLLGYQPAEMLGRNSYELLASTDIPQVCAAHTSMLTTTGTQTMEHRVRCRDGSLRWFESSGQAIRDPATGAVRELIVVSRDISERKRAEELAHMHRLEMAHVARVATIGEMASGFAHELAQPLSAITYYARGAGAQLESGKWAAPDVRDVLRRIAAQADRAAEFIRRMKSFVRRSSAGSSVGDLSAITREALDFVAPEFEAAPVTLQTDLADGLPPIHVDPIQIEQVVINLVRNSIEALAGMDDLGHDPTITVTTERADDQHVAVRCTDNGPGVSADLRSQIFEPFITSKPSGIGLGLSISRSIIEAHGGKLELSPQTPRGACFVVTLPIVERGHE